MTSGSKGFAWHTVCGGPIWLCFGLSLCLLSALVLRYLPILSFPAPFPMGLSSGTMGKAGGKTIVKLSHQLSFCPRAGYFAGLKTEGLEPKTIPRFLPPESDQNAIALPMWQALLGE